MMFKIGESVYIDNIDCEGVVCGHGFYQSQHFSTMSPMYIIRLAKGQWTEERKAFIDIVVAHPDNVYEIGEQGNS